MKTPRFAQRIYDALDKPRSAKSIHGWLAVGFVFPGIPIAYVFRESTVFLVIISMLALIIGEIVAWGDNGNVLDERHRK